MATAGTARTIVAVPVANGKLCAHFGHCQEFAFYEVDMQQRRIEGSRRLEPPPHEPGLLPRWLRSQNAQVVIAAGLGHRARSIFQEQGMEVLVGAPADEPHEVVQAYLDGTLKLVDNPCDH